MQIAWPKQWSGPDVKHDAGLPLLIVVPVSMAALALAVMGLTMGATADQRVHLFIAAGVGFIAWSLIEYGFHRFILHGIWPFRPWHAAHHAGARPYEAWGASLMGAMLLVMLTGQASVWLGSAWIGMGACVGLLTGQGTCLATHHAIHHLHSASAWLTQRKFHHAMHHDPHGGTAYYGITSCLWDRLLRTRHLQEF